MSRLCFLAALAAALAACAPATPVAVFATAVSAPTATPFLPRGFTGLPTATPAAGPTKAAPVGPAATATPGIDLKLIAEAVNRLRANDGLAALTRNEALDAIAGARAAQLAETGALWHSRGTQGAPEVERQMGAGGFTGRVAEVVLSVEAANADPDGAALQAILTDPLNRDLVIGTGFGFGGFGAAEDGGTLYVVILLAENGAAS
jgi:uncharacterized protein YkwD